MQTDNHLKARLENLVAMARLLERVDADPTQVGAAQYRQLSSTVQGLLSEDIPDDALKAVLRAFPAVAVLYENLHYDRSGLSQSPLDSAMDSELLAGSLIDRIRLASRPTPRAE